MIAQAKRTHYDANKLEAAGQSVKLALAQLRHYDRKEETFASKAISFLDNALIDMHQAGVRLESPTQSNQEAS